MISMYTCSSLPPPILECTLKVLSNLSYDNILNNAIEYLLLLLRTNLIRKGLRLLTHDYLAHAETLR